MAISNTDLAQQISDAVASWEAFVLSVAAWAVDEVDTVSFLDPLGGPDKVVQTLWKIETDYANLTGAEWANTPEDVLVPSGDLIDDYSALHWARKAQQAAQGVIDVSEDVAAAEAAAAAALVSETNAAASAAAAATSETNAGTSETNAAASASAAATSQSQAATSEGNAAASAAAAATSESNAGTSETNAAASAAAASTSETNAAASEAKAEDWAIELEDVEVEVGKYSALHHAAKASASAANAATSESNAGTSETNAAASESNASTSASNAATSESNANTAKTAAEAARDKAQDWAMELEDVAVETGEYSAYHWAKKAEYWAGQAAVTEFDNLTDVDITGRTDGMVVYWDQTSDKLKFQANGSAPVTSVAGKTGAVTLVKADITDFSDGDYATSGHTHAGVYEPAFSKNTGFNKNLGTSAGTVAEGNHNHSGVYEPAFSKNTAFNKNFGSAAGTVAEGDHTHAKQTAPLIVAVSDETTDLETGTAKVTFRMPCAWTLTAVRASVGTAPTGSVLTVDINEGGTSILSTKLTIDAGEKTSTTAATAAVISDSSLADDAEMTIDIDGVGSTTPGKGLKVYLIGYPT